MVELLEALLPILFKIWKILNNIIVIAVIFFILSIIGIVVSICCDNARAKKEKDKNLNKNKYTKINSVIVPQIAANIRKNESDIIREQNYLVGNRSAIAYRHNIKDENLLDFYKVISKEKIAYIDLKPKTRKQVYLLPKGVCLKIGDDHVKVIEGYNINNNTIKVCKKIIVRDNEDDTAYDLSIEEIFDYFNLTSEKVSMNYYINKFDNYINDEVMLPPIDNISINKWFLSYIESQGGKSNKKDFIFIRTYGLENEIENEDKRLELYEFFDSRVNPFMYDLCLCVIAMHEYDYLGYASSSLIQDKQELYRKWKKRLPWLDVEMANTYFNNISKEKSVYIKYMDLHRRSLITEAYVNYLYTKGDFSMEILYNATDKEVSDMYYKYVSEKNVRKEASDWVDRYCFNNK